MESNLGDLYDFDLSSKEIPIQKIISNTNLNPKAFRNKLSINTTKIPDNSQTNVIEKSVKLTSVETSNIKLEGSGSGSLDKTKNKKSNTLNIILLVLLCILVFFYIVNYLELKKINNEYTILQKFKPNKENMLDIFREKHPVVITGMVEDWFIYNEDDTINKKKLSNEVLNDNTKILDRIFTIGKKYDILTLNKGKKTKLVNERNTRHLLVVLNGNITVHLFNNEQKIEYEKKGNSKVGKYQPFDNADKLKETKYMEIKVYEEQILYIPYGWWFCYRVESDSLLLDINSETVFSIVLNSLL